MHSATPNLSILLFRQFKPIDQKSKRLYIRTPKNIVWLQTLNSTVHGLEIVPNCRESWKPLRKVMQPFV